MSTADAYVQITATGTLSPDTEAAIARIQVAHQQLMDRLAEIVDEDHTAALVEDQDRARAGALQHAAMRGEINRMIERERVAAQVCAPRPKDRRALADRAETEWRARNPALAEFRDFGADATRPTRRARP